MSQSGISRLRRTVSELTKAADLEGDTDSDHFMSLGKEAILELITNDDWLPEEYAVSHPDHYQQYLLHCDPLERFSLISFVWGPSQKTPVHDHRTWGLIGMLRGSEISQSYEKAGDGKLVPGRHEVLKTGDVSFVSPQTGDIHEVINAHDDRISISIHLYGDNIGLIERSVFEPSSGSSRPFISGYSSSHLPNIWGLTV